MGIQYPLAHRQGYPVSVLSQLPDRPFKGERGPCRPRCSSAIGVGHWSNVGGSVTPFAGNQIPAFRGPASVPVSIPETAARAQPRIVTPPPWFIFSANMAGVSEMAALQSRGL